MRSALIKALGTYRKAANLYRKLRGIDAEDVAAERVISGKAWEEYCDTLKAAGAAISGTGAPLDARTQAEGYRYLSRLVRASLQAFVEQADPKAPILQRMVHETVKMGADNPDNYYQNATISGEHEYRLHGSRGTVHFLHFATQRGNYGQGGGMPPTGFLDSGDLELDDDGNLEIILSREKKPGNWLPMERETGLLIVRQTFLDRDSETPAQLTIERIDGDGKPEPLTAKQLDDGLKTAGNFVAGAPLLFAKWANGFKKHTNELPQFDPDTSTAAGGDPNIAYYHSYWALEPDEALVVEVTPPECELWNFQINNHWMESLDYRYFRIHLNKHTAHYEPDGSVKVILAHEDPGHPNWLQTTGHRQGTMCWRWTKASHHPVPQTKVVKLASLRTKD